MMQQRKWYHEQTNPADMNVVFLSYLVCTKLSASVFILFKDVEYGDYLTPTTTTTTTTTPTTTKVLGHSRKDHTA